MISSISFQKINSLFNSQKKEIENIFWETSGKKKEEFSSNEALYNFENAYLNSYLNDGDTFVAIENKKIISYLLFHHQTELLLVNPIINNNYKFFSDELLEYPTSLHINVSSVAQGKRVGGRLMEHSLNFLKPINKIHLITHKDSRNVRFYERLGFKALKVDQRGLVFLAYTIN